MISIKRYALPVIGLTLAIAGAVSISVTTGLAQTHQQATPDSAMQAAQVAQVALAAFQMDGSGLHALDEGTAAGTIPSGALGRVRKARIVVQATSWPEAMQAQVREFVEHALALETALAAEDAAAAAPDAKAVHDIGHDLSNAAYAWLAATSGAPAGEHGHN